MVLSCWINYGVLLVMVCFAMAEAANNSSSSLAETEREALVSTGWWENQIYLANTCDWIGITCSKGGRVISIDLSSKEIYITGELGKLNFSSFPSLQTLDLSGCGLGGSIPYQIGILSKQLQESTFSTPRLQ